MLGSTSPDGVAYIDGRFMGIEEATIPITDWGYRRSDVTYDVVGVWRGAFFRLDDHLRRFRNSIDAMRMTPPESDDDIRGILTECVRRSGLREAYVAMDCLRGRPSAGMTRHPINCRNYLAIFAVPWVWVLAEDVLKRGVHLIVSSVERISDQAVDPKVKNFHWGDFTRASFEAHDRGADSCVLLDDEGFVTEGPGFNVFAVRDGKVVTPNRGALEGITRLSVKEVCGELKIPFAEGALTAQELCDADEIFLSTTAGGVMPVSRIDGRILGNDRPGHLSSLIRDHYWQRREQGWHATPIKYDN